MSAPWVMTSCSWRHKVRQPTLKQLHAHGIHPTLILDPCQPPRTSNVMRNAWVGLTPYRYNEAGVIFCEDDIDIRPALLKHFLPLIEYEDRIVTMCVIRHALYPGYVPEHAKTMTPTIVQLERINQRRGYHGTMCVYIPPHVLQEMHARQNEFCTLDHAPLDAKVGFDFWLKQNADNLGGLWAAVPNPVNHRAGPSTWNEEKQTKAQRLHSSTYHIPATGIHES